MTLLAALLLANHALVSRMAYQLDLRELTRGGDTYTPTNAPSNVQGGTMIVTPGAQITGAFVHNQKLQLRYAPQLLFTLPGITNQPPAVFHSLKGSYGIGDPLGTRFTLTTNFTLGQIDGATAGALLGDFGGFMGAAPTGSQADYVSVSVKAKLEHSWGRHWHASTQETVGELSSGGSGVSAFEGSVATAPSQLLVALQTQFSAYSKNELEYKINPNRSLVWNLQLSDVSFPLTSSYLGVMPQMGGKAGFDDGSRVDVKLGAFCYWSNPFPHVFSRLNALPGINIIAEHPFTNQGLPRLRTRLTFGIGPYYDLFFGEQQPRTQLVLEATYDFTHQWQARASFKYYTSSYYNFKEWVYVGPGRTKELAMLRLGLKYKYSKWLAFDGGMYTDERWYHASAEQSYPFIRELYFLLGAKVNLQVDPTQALDPTDMWDPTQSWQVN